MFKNCIIRFHTESSSIFGNANQTQLQPIDYKLFGYKQKYGKPVSKTNDKPAFAKKLDLALYILIGLSNNGLQL